MNRQLHEKHRERWARYGFQNLLVWLFVYLVVGPFLESTPFATTILSAFLTIVLVSAIAAIGRIDRLLRLALGILAIVLVLMWLETWNIVDSRVKLSTMGLIGFLAIIGWSFGKHLFRIRKVNGNVICAALCLYLIIGMLWGALFTVLESLVPGSFSGNLLKDAASTHTLPHHLQYFSYVTLSTLGYGDITPQTRGAAALCQTEAILGQFLTVVLVARLVGIQVAQETTPDPS